MLCYKGMTFCPFWLVCSKGPSCDRALTNAVLKAAEEWWAGEEGEPPIAKFAEKPDCFKEDVCPKNLQQIHVDYAKS